MKNRLFILMLGGLLVGALLQAQNSQKLTSADYAAYPHYMEMMLNPNSNFYEIQKAFYTYWEGREITRGSGYKPFKRWEYYWQSRINPDGTFPKPGKTFKEYERYVQEHPVAGNLKSGAAIWQELGPKTRHNYGGYVGVGRINAIAFHPTDTLTIYIGAPSGGFWRTHDGGVTWETTTDSLPTLGVSAIFVNPDHPEQILIGTGDRDGGSDWGIGVMRSNDGGDTWELSNTGMGEITVGMFAAHETNPDIILAAANGGLFKTTDGGLTWVRTSANSANYRDVKFKPGDMTVAYCTANTGFYRSEDGGDSWTLIGSDQGLTAGGRKVIGVTPANDSLVYVVAGGGPFQGCFLSRDFGQTFVTQSDTPNILGYAYEGNDDKSQAGYDLDIHVDPHNPNIVHVGGVNLWRSNDAGRHWTITGHWWGDRTNEVHADQHTFAYNPVNDELYAGNDGGIYHTGNNGGTWTEISEGLGIGQIYKLGVSNTNPHKTITGFQDNGSATWMGTYWVNTGGGDGMECAVDPYDDRYSYSTIYNGAITRWISNGSSRRVAGENTGGIDEKGAWVTPFFISGDNPNILVVGMKNVWMTRTVKSQGTIHYTKISNNLADRNDVNMAELEQSPADFNVLYAARGDNKLFRTDNLMDHPTWSDLTRNLPVSRTPSDIECHPYDPNTVYITVNSKIYKSVDKGVHWTDISGSLPNIPINDVVYDKTSNEGLYVGTDAGVYYKDADMNDWVQHGIGLPVSVEVSELEIYYDRMDRSASKLRASTFGRGMWEIELAPSDAVLPPTILTATTGSDFIDLEWVAPFYAQTITGYKVYRDSVEIAQVNGTSYEDLNIEKDVTYHYWVTAIYGGTNESDPSNVAFATVLAPIELDYSQDFERGNAGWNAKYTIEGWKYGLAADLGIEGDSSHFFGINSSTVPGLHVTDYLYTPSIDLSSYTGKTVTFKFRYTMRNYRNYDKLQVVYRVSADSAWVKLADLSAPSRLGWEWTDFEVNLPEEALVDGTQVGLYYNDSNEQAWGAGVDDIQLFVNTSSVLTLENSLTVKIYPNPASERISVTLTDPEPGTVSMQLFSIDGKQVSDYKFETYGGDLVKTLDISNLAKGVYQMVIRSGKSIWKDKITIQ